MRVTIFLGVEGKWTSVKELWEWTGEEDSRAMTIDDRISLSSLHERVYDKF